MNVLVVAPHPDDEAIGCGGTIIRHAQSGDSVWVAFLTSGELSLRARPAEEVRALREQEAAAAAAVLGLAEYAFLRQPDFGVADDLDGAGAVLDEVVRRAQPERIYVPHAQEWHPDHRAALTITMRVAADQKLPSTGILTYEVWTPLTDYQTVEDISDHMAQKLEAIQCYRSQLETFDYVRAATGLSQYRGALAARTAYAEVFGHPPEGDAASRR